MKQIIQYLNNEEISIIEAPKPTIKKKNIIIKSEFSLISSGTEKMITDFAKSNFLGKAAQQPERLKEVVNKFYSDGLIETFKAVNSKINIPIELGYCNVGRVLEVGPDCKGFAKGDRVISNGPHAEIISVTENLCAKIPDNVSDQEAVFTVLASIGLHGIRLSEPTIGEHFLVSGLGLIGLLTCQILKANGCNVLAIDPDKNKCATASILGINSHQLVDDNELIKWIKRNTSGIGVDAVLITASTESSKPIKQAANACRKKGRIIMIGSTGMQLDRNDFYRKELSFKVSCSYGPGRYDSNYELEGNDYPIGYVRWTEKRNFETILELLSKKLISTNELITNTFLLKNAKDAYKLLNDKSKSLGILLEYDNYTNNLEFHEEIKENKSAFPSKELSNFKIDNSINNFGFIGAGNYSTRVLIPAFKKQKINLHTLVANSGVKTSHYAKKFNFNSSSTDVNKIFKNEEIGSIVIASRHDSHADFIIRAIKEKKHIFVEKPLCINLTELNQIKKYYLSNQKEKTSPIIMVGFNRRFSPLIKKLKNLIKSKNNKFNFVYTCNAGQLEKNHWLNNPSIGGGRLIGEACHFIDLLRFLSDSKIASMKIFRFDKTEDSFSLNISFQNGSVGSVNYFTNGNKRYPKEELKVFAEGEIYILNNFKSLEIWDNKNKYHKIRLLSQDKGQLECVKLFINSIKKGICSPIPIDEIFEVQQKILEI